MCSKMLCMVLTKTVGYTLIITVIQSNPRVSKSYFIFADSNVQKLTVQFDFSRSSVKVLR